MNIDNSVLMARGKGGWGLGGGGQRVGGNGGICNCVHNKSKGEKSKLATIRGLN